MAGLLDFAQAASNSAAGNVAGPIDMLAWGLRKMGLPIPNDPVLGTEWMKQKGLIKEVPQSPASLAGETFGLLSPIVAAAKAPQIAGGLLQMGDNLSTAKTLGSGPGGGQKGAIVYHGSPHKFDKFDSSKIGTGEGKQQQGVGTYLAEARAVGQGYADKESFKRGMDSGYLYKVDVPDNLTALMANHDAPMSAQPANVRDAVFKMLDADALKALRGYHGWEDPNAAPFAAVMDALEVVRGNNRAATSDALSKAGIPGIRYLDQGSRAAGQGTANYVIFPGNEGLLTILERNGVPLR